MLRTCLIRKLNEESEFSREGEVTSVAFGFRLRHRDMLRDLTGLLVFLLLLAPPSDPTLSCLLVLFHFTFRLLSSSCERGFSQREILVLAGVDFPRKTLNRLDVVEAEPGHFLTRLLHLLNAWREVAEFALLAKHLESVFDGDVRLGQVKEDCINRAFCHSLKLRPLVFCQLEQKAVCEDISMSHSDVRRETHRLEISLGLVHP